MAPKSVHFWYSFILTIVSAQPPPVFEPCSSPPPLITYPLALPSSDSTDCDFPLRGNLNLSLATFRLPPRPSPGHDLLEVFRPFQDCPGCVRFQLDYTVFKGSEFNLNFKLSCRGTGNRDFKLDIGATPSVELQTTVDLFPDGARFHPSLECSPFASKYRIEFDIWNRWLRFERSCSGGWMELREDGGVGNKSKGGDCSGIWPKFETMWRCNEIMKSKPDLIKKNTVMEKGKDGSKAGIVFCFVIVGCIIMVSICSLR